LKAKVTNTVRPQRQDDSNSLAGDYANPPKWLLEAERTLEEKQETVNRLIVQSQQAFFMAKVSCEYDPLCLSLREIQTCF
jgi:hypothetical protein